MSSLMRVASGMPLIAMPAIVSGSLPEFSASSRMMSVMAAAPNPTRVPSPPPGRPPPFPVLGRRLATFQPAGEEPGDRLRREVELVADLLLAETLRLVLRRLFREKEI